MDRPTIAERTDRLASQLQMTDFVDQRCGTLSSGQTQKANLARAFLHDPPALILDEPTTALDIVTGRFVLEAIDRARSVGKAVLFSTHTMTEAEFLCDRVVLLHQGRVMDQGPIPDVCERAGARSLADAFLKHVDISEAAG
jgi:sodium transport system ATP-binding protein